MKFCVYPLNCWKWAALPSAFPTQHPQSPHSNLISLRPHPSLLELSPKLPLSSSEGTPVCTLTYSLVLGISGYGEDGTILSPRGCGEDSVPAAVPSWGIQGADSGSGLG